MILSIIFFITALGFYCISAILYLWNMTGRSAKTSRAASIAVSVGLGAHTIGIIIRGVEQNLAPFTNLFESLMFVSWALVAIYLFMERRYKINGIGAFVSIIAIITTTSAILMPKEINSSLLPVLDYRWRVVHVASSLLGYASFVLAFGMAVGYMLQERMLKSKKVGILQKHMPSLDVMDQISYKMVAIGFPMLTLGIVSGALWAQIAWGSYWSWDPKETWSLITWLVYAAYLHVRILQGWRGKLANRLLIAGFICIVITFLGVNFLSEGLHRYNW